MNTVHTIDNAIAHWVASPRCELATDGQADMVRVSVLRGDYCAETDGLGAALIALLEPLPRRSDPLRFHDLASQINRLMFTDETGWPGVSGDWVRGFLAGWNLVARRGVSGKTLHERDLVQQEAELGEEFGHCDADGYHVGALLADKWTRREVGQMGPCGEALTAIELGWWYTRDEN